MEQPISAGGKTLAGTGDVPARVQRHLDAFLSSRAHLLQDIGPELATLQEALTSLISSGKRLRPSFCYWGWRGHPGADLQQDDDVLAAATALELLQACALLHDDVMDRSDTRRGLPSAHRRFAAAHRRHGWRGDGERFGEGAAILLGDLCLAWTDEAFLASGLPPESLLRAKRVLDLMRTEVMAGQYLDLVEQARGEATPEEVMRVVRYKSAKYTIERPLQLGGLLAGEHPELMRTYSAYGLPLGEAFQLRDDVLGVYGDPVRTGKPAGDDLREGKRTLLVVLALETATSVQAGKVHSLLGDPALDAQGVAELREIFRKTGALAAVEDRIASLTAQARQALRTSVVTAEARQILDELAVAATARAE